MKRVRNPKTIVWILYHRNWTAKAQPKAGVFQDTHPQQAHRKNAMTSAVLHFPYPVTQTWVESFCRFHGIEASASKRNRDGCTWTVICSDTKDTQELVDFVSSTTAYVPGDRSPEPPTPATTTKLLADAVHELADELRLKRISQQKNTDKVDVLLGKVGEVFWKQMLNASQPATRPDGLPVAVEDAYRRMIDDM